MTSNHGKHSLFISRPKIQSSLFIFLLPTVIVLCSCTREKDYDKHFNDPSLFSNTVHELNTVVMGNNFGPIVASRNYLYAAIAAYEVIAASYPDRYLSLARQLDGLDSLPAPDPNKPFHPGLTAILAYCELGESVTFPEGSMKQYVDSLKKMATDHGMPRTLLEGSQLFADRIAEVIGKWSKSDNYSRTRGAPEYMVNDIPGRWVPTPPGYTSAMEPHWGEIRSLVLDSPTEFLPPPPYPFDVTNKNSPFYKEVDLVRRTGDSLNADQLWIADFWDDNPFKLNVSGHLMFGTKKFSPGGHWMIITGIVAHQASADMPKTIYAYAKTAIALFDAFIACWDIKYIYTTARPETIINRYEDPNWRPHLQTPPFPEYTCGHCTISAAAAEALTSVFGDNVHYTDSSEMEFGIPSRKYHSFYEAAEENEKARFYGGIHYQYCCRNSHEMGSKLGKLIVTRLHMKK